MEISPRMTEIAQTTDDRNLLQHSINQQQTLKISRFFSLKQRTVNSYCIAILFTFRHVHHYEELNKHCEFHATFFMQLQVIVLLLQILRVFQTNFVNCVSSNVYWTVHHYNS